jgi:GTP cyclohydrolase II
MDAPAIAVPLPDGLARAGFYRSLADPTMPQAAVPGELGTVAAPPSAAAAIQLAKIGQLLPALLAKALPADAAATVRAHGLVQVDATDIQRYGDYETASLQSVSAAVLPLADAPDSRIVAFRTHASALEHYAILVGHPEQAPEPLVRIHSCCFTGDLLGSMRCDCGEQLRGAIRRMADDGSGVLLYLSQEGRGIGLANKLRAYELQDRGLDTMDANRALGWGADERNFMTGAAMLQILGIKRIRLLTNNPDKMAALAARGIEVAGREAHLFEPNGVNDEYLATKASRFGHMLD